MIEDFATGMDHFIEARALDETDYVLIDNIHHLTMFMEATWSKVKGPTGPKSRHLLAAPLFGCSAQL